MSGKTSSKRRELAGLWIICLFTAAISAAAVAGLIGMIWGVVTGTREGFGDIPAFVIGMLVLMGLAFLGFTGWLAGYHLIRSSRALVKLHRQFPTGHCQVCGYDVRASGDHCPECGTKTSRAVARDFFQKHGLRPLPPPCDFPPHGPPPRPDSFALPPDFPAENDAR